MKGICGYAVVKLADQRLFLFRIPVLPDQVKNLDRNLEIFNDSIDIVACSAAAVVHLQQLFLIGFPVYPSCVKMISQIMQGYIEPKPLDGVCQYCKYKDLCYRTEEDIVELKVKPLKEIVGDESA